MKEKKILKATHGSNKSPLIIGNIEVPCYVLEGGKRVVSLRGMQKALGFSSSGSGKALKNMLDNKRIFPFIDRVIKDALNDVVEFKRPGSGGAAPATHGYEASVLIDICNSLIDAKNNAKLTSKELVVCQQAEIIIRSVAKVGIVALIDEATGYQEVRDRNALQVILDKYLTDEWAKWTKTFPDDFYKELFRLKGIAYPPRSGKKASYVGHWTNDVVYDRLVPGLKEELKKKNPVTGKGHMARKHHQHLTQDIGHPKLKEFLTQIVFLMKTCSTYREFRDRLARVAPKYNETMTLPMETSS